MGPQHQLAQNLTSESKAYGYTLTIWGGGSVLGAVLGAPTLVETFAYVGGALAAFAVVLAVTFDRLVVDASIGDRIPVPSMLHLVATSGAVLGAFLLVTAVEDAVSQTVAFALAGLQLTLTYNTLLPVETLAVRRTLDSVGVDVEDTDEAGGGA